MPTVSATADGTRNMQCGLLYRLVTLANSSTLSNAYQLGNPVRRRDKGHSIVKGHTLKGFRREWRENAIPFHRRISLLPRHSSDTLDTLSHSADTSLFQRRPSNNAV